MCKCTPNIRTPFCGKPGCEWPEQSKDQVTPDQPHRILDAYEALFRGGLEEMRRAARLLVQREDEIAKLESDLAWIRRRTGFWGEVPKEQSDTPLTDAVVWHAEEDSMPRIPVVDADFARRLERRIVQLEAQMFENMADRCGFISGNRVMGWQHPHSTQPPGDAPK
jgi:hypothetical protein